jgi:hypothetical protein
VSEENLISPHPSLTRFEVALFNSPEGGIFIAGVVRHRISFHCAWLARRATQSAGLKKRNFKTRERGKSDLATSLADASGYDFSKAQAKAQLQKARSTWHVAGECVRTITTIGPAFLQNLAA